MKREKIFRSEHSVKDSWDNVRRSNIMIIRGPEGDNNQSPRRERENGSENVMAEKFPS